ANSAAHFLHPRAATRAKLHGGERIALIIKRREASNAATGDRAWGKFLHSRDVLRTATEPMTAKEIASGVLAAANITDAYQAQRQCTKCRRSAWGRRQPNLDIWAGLRAQTLPSACSLSELLRVLLRQRHHGSNFVAANSDSSADPFAKLDLPSAPNRI